MKISDLEFYLVEVPSAGDPSRIRALLVRLATDEGAEGWGECHLPWRPEELNERREMYLPSLAGREVVAIEDLLALQPVSSVPPLCAALEMACWDLIGRTAGMPVCHLLGGVYRDRIPLAVRLPREPADRIPQLARGWAEQGFASQIVSSTGDVPRDLATLQAVRESAAERAELRLDGANGFDAWTARELCSELERTGIEFLLDPLQDRHFEQAADLSRQTSVPIAISTRMNSPDTVLAAIRAGAMRHLVVDLEQVGGILNTKKCAIVATAGHVRALLASQASLGLATAAMLQAAACTPAFASANESAYHRLQDDILTEPLEVLDGTIAVPIEPGLGVEVDRGKIEKYLVT